MRFITDSEVKRTQEGIVMLEDKIKRLEALLEEALQVSKKLEQEKADLVSEHNRKLQDKEFQLAHFKDAELQAMEGENIKLRQEVAVLTKQVEMLDKVIALDADIIDVKSLIQQLIGKLPEIKLQNLTVSAKE